MNLAGRVVTTALAVAATGALAAGLVDPGRPAPAEPGSSRPTSRERARSVSGRLPSTLVCPPAPRVADAGAEDADEDFQAEGDTDLEHR